MDLVKCIGPVGHSNVTQLQTGGGGQMGAGLGHGGQLPPCLPPPLEPPMILRHLSINLKKTTDLSVNLSSVVLRHLGNRNILS